MDINGLLTKPGMKNVVAKMNALAAVHVKIPARMGQLPSSEELYKGQIYILQAYIEGLAARYNNMLRWCSSANHSGLSSRRLGFESRPEHHTFFPFESQLKASMHSILPNPRHVRIYAPVSSKYIKVFV